MKCLLVLTVSNFVTFMDSVARADEGLDGTWKLTNTECASGSPANNFGDNIEGKVEGTLTISGNRLNSVMVMKFRYKEDYAKQRAKHFEEWIALVQSQPDSPEKQSSLAQMKDALIMVNQFTAGVSCQVSETHSYSAEEATLITTPISRSSNCPGDEPTDLKAYNVPYEIKGDTLRVFANESEKQDGGICPAGDRVIVTVFTKSK